MRKAPITLIKKGMNCYFESAVKAGEFLKIPPCEISLALSRNGTCHGWKPTRGYAEPEPLKPEVVIQREIVYTTARPVLSVNGLLTPNKTEREYYDYQAKKGAKA